MPLLRQDLVQVLLLPCSSRSLCFLPHAIDLLVPANKILQNFERTKNSFLYRIFTTSNGDTNRSFVFEISFFLVQFLKSRVLFGDLIVEAIDVLLASCFFLFGLKYFTTHCGLQFNRFYWTYSVQLSVNLTLSKAVPSSEISCFKSSISSSSLCFTAVISALLSSSSSKRSFSSVSWPSMSSSLPRAFWRSSTVFSKDSDSCEKSYQFYINSIIYITLFI